MSKKKEYLSLNNIKLFDRIEIILNDNKRIIGYYEWRNEKYLGIYSPRDKMEHKICLSNINTIIID